jgi:protein-arginine kinase activator protein McsA
MEVERLQQELRECVRMENYERAAEIRDRIRQLEAGRGGGR